MATGDITSVIIGADGWFADIVIEGLSTGGTYSLGLGSNNDPLTGTPKIVFTVVSLGYDSTGAATTVTRTVYGTKAVRKTTPNEAQSEESGSNPVTVRVALSDYIYAKDATGTGNSGTAPTVTILAGFYTQGGTPNNASGSGFAVTNNSTASYPKVLASWSRPPYERVTGNFNLGVVAFHGTSVWNGSSQVGAGKHNIACVVFSVTDTHSHTVTTTVTSPTVDSSYGDAIPVVEHLTTIDVSTLDALDVLTGNFTAYPLIGDSASIVSSSGGTSQPTPLVGPLPLLNDKSNTYGVTCALVDPTGSDSGANTVYDSASFNPSTAYKFATIGKAAAAIAAYNNTNRSRNTVGGGIVYCNAGSYAWLGSSNAYGTTPSDWITVKPAAGVAKADVIIASTSGNTDISDRVKIEGVTITSATTSTFFGINALWLHDCVINSSGTAVFRLGSVVWLTKCTLTRLDQGVRGFSTENCSFALVRGCDFTGFTKTVVPYCFVGNKKTGKSTATTSFITGGISGQGIPQPESQIIAFNKILGVELSGVAMIQLGTLAASASPSRGTAMVQNVFEWTAANSTELSAVASSESISTDTPFDNVIIWHMTEVGQRQNWAYNSSGSTVKYRRYWSVKNCSLHDFNIKSDTFPTANAARVGNWPCLYGVGWSGNLLADSGNGFSSAFGGLKTREDSWTAPANSFFLYTDYKAYTGTGGAGAGDGDYTLQANSPAVSLSRDSVVPYDLAGLSRSTTSSAAGAYHYATTASNFLFFF